jgi:hypothetical protein
VENFHGDFSFKENLWEPNWPRELGLVKRMDPRKRALRLITEVILHRFQTPEILKLITTG